MPAPEILSHIEAYVRDLYKTQFSRWRYFHNIQHTVTVVEQCRLLSDHYALHESEVWTLIAAAWFHDTGYSRGNINHEEQSVQIAFEFLAGFEVEQEHLTKIEQLILATRLAAQPSTLTESILCDSDLYHLASPEYKEWSVLLKREVETQHGIVISEDTWNQENISFFKNHQYRTEYAILMWQQQKQENLSALLNTLMNNRKSF